MSSMYACDIGVFPSDEVKTRDNQKLLSSFQREK